MKNTVVLSTCVSALCLLQAGVVFAGQTTVPEMNAGSVVIALGLTIAVVALI
jgi:hypothetical protein